MRGERTARDAMSVRGGHRNYLAGEPVFVAKPGASNEGILIVQHLIPAEERVEYLILDAFRLRQGPIATLRLNHPLHPGFHASFRTFRN